MKTSFLLKSSLLATTGVYILPQLLFAQTSTRPHIILIVSDQHRGDAMNCMGNTSVISPNMDALAEQRANGACTHQWFDRKAGAFARGKAAHGGFGAYHLRFSGT